MDKQSNRIDLKSVWIQLINTGLKLYIILGEQQRLQTMKLIEGLPLVVHTDGRQVNKENIDNICSYKFYGKKINRQIER